MGSSCAGRYLSMLENNKTLKMPLSITWLKSDKNIKIIFLTNQIALHAGLNILSKISFELQLNRLSRLLLCKTLYILYCKAMHRCSIKLLQEHVPVTAYRNGLFYIILLTGAVPQPLFLLLIVLGCIIF